MSSQLWVSCDVANPYVWHGHHANPCICWCYPCPERVRAGEPPLALHHRHASRVAPARPPAQGGHVSVHQEKCITQRRPWPPSPFLKAHWQRGPGFRIGWTSTPSWCHCEIMKKSYTAEVFFKAYQLLQHRNGHSQHQEHGESQQEWTCSDGLLVFFILHSINRIWKDLVIKNRKLKDLVEEHQDCSELPHLTKEMWFSLHGWSKKKSSNMSTLVKLLQAFYLLVLCSVSPTKDGRLRLQY